MTKATDLEALRSRLRKTLYDAFEHWITAEWICCDPPQKDHKLCKKGHTTLQMIRVMLRDDPGEHPQTSPILDALMAELTSDISPPGEPAS